MPVQTVQGCLDTYYQQVQGAINGSTNEPIQQGLGVKLLLRQTIENTKAVFHAVLFENLEQVNQLTRGIVTRLGQLIERANTNALENLATDVQQVALDLPFEDECPRLTSASPRFVIRSSADNNASIPFRFMGNFLHATRQNYAPTLRFGDQQPIVISTSSTDQQLEFSIPRNVVFSDQRLQTNKLIYNEAVLTIPGPERSETFKITIGALPASGPGPITFFYDVDRTDHQEQVKMNDFHHCSRGGCCGDADHSKTFGLPATQGWQIKDNTWTATELGGSGGLHSAPTFVGNQNSVVKYSVSTRREPVIEEQIDKVALVALGPFALFVPKKQVLVGYKNHGISNFRISFTEQKDTPVTDTHASNIALGWGQSTPINYPLGKWRMDIHHATAR